MQCLSLSYKDKLGNIPIDRKYCLDVWEKADPKYHVLKVSMVLVDSFWFNTEEARAQYIKDCYHANNR
jgi:hypothetical protein